MPKVIKVKNEPLIIRTHVADEEEVYEFDQPQHSFTQRNKTDINMTVTAQPGDIVIQSDQISPRHFIRLLLGSLTDIANSIKLKRLNL